MEIMKKGRLRFNKIEKFSFYSIIVLFFIPLLILYILSFSSFNPSTYYQFLFWSCLLISIFELLFVFILIFGFFVKISISLILLRIIFIGIGIAGIYLSYQIVTSAVP